MSQPTSDHSPVVQNNDSEGGSPFMPALVLLGGMALMLLLVMSSAADRSAGQPQAVSVESEAPVAVAEAETVSEQPEADNVESEAPAAVAEAETAAESEPSTAVADAESASEESQPAVFVPTSQQDYVRYCSACHGVDGQGVQYMGTALSESELVMDNANSAALIEFLTEGRPLADPRIEFPHPYRGGYPALTDQQIIGLVGYVHQLIQQ